MASFSEEKISRILSSYEQAKGNPSSAARILGDVDIGSVRKYWKLNNLESTTSSSRGGARIAGRSKVSLVLEERAVQIYDSVGGDAATAAIRLQSTKKTITTIWGKNNLEPREIKKYHMGIDILLSS